MDVASLKRIEEIYHAALDTPPESRESFLKEVCAGDDGLRREVESLLAVSLSFDNFLVAPPAALAADMLNGHQARLTGLVLGSYKIIQLLGQGGMGEVYLAEDVRLNRKVALKMLPAELTGNPERLKRFAREAQAVSALNHPNILTLHEFSAAGETHFIVMEFVRGETLGERMQRGRMPVGEVLEVARQVASALSAAHETGIIHRDVKPDNIMLRDDGIVKVLDFGLAKLTGSGKDIHSTEPSGGATRPMSETRAGVIMGTTNYMSPEQAHGKAVDARSDIFSFGVVLYEMLAGRPPFTGESPADVMSAILKDEPPDLSVTNPQLNPALLKIVRTCLEKKPERRFYSAHDLGFALEAAAGSLSGSGWPPVVPVRREKIITRERLAWLLAAVFATLAVAGFVYSWHLRGRQTLQRAFRQLNFRREAIFQAAFAPDGKTVVYSAATEGNTPEIFTIHPEFPAPQMLGGRGMHLLDVSSKGELAILTDAVYLRHRTFTGTLSQMPLVGGAPRQILEGVRHAAWSPDGAQLAIIREVEGQDRLEYPIGKVLCETSGNFSDARISPDGQRIAFFEHPRKADDRGSVAMVDLNGKKTTLSDGYWTERGLAWSPDSAEVLFSAGLNGSNYMIFAVTLAGVRRIADQSPGGLVLQAITPDGRWLVNRLDFRYSAMAHTPAAPEDLDLSWLRTSKARALAQDGKTLIFSEDSITNAYAVCLQKLDGSPVVRLGDGTPVDLSFDGKWALAIIPSKPAQLVAYSTGAGETRRIDRANLENYISAQWFRDGQRILINGNEPGQGARFYVQETGGQPRAVTPEGTRDGKLAPDGKFILARGAGGKYFLYPVAGDAAPRPVAWLDVADIVVGWSADNLSVFVYRGAAIPCRVERVNLETGRRELFREMAPANRTGLLSVRPNFITDNQQSYAYTTYQQVSTLFVTE